MMAVCHTAVPEREGDKIVYQAASPGESQITEWTYSKVLKIIKTIYSTSKFYFKCIVYFDTSSEIKEENISLKKKCQLESVLSKNMNVDFSDLL